MTVYNIHLEMWTGYINIFNYCTLSLGEANI